MMKVFRDTFPQGRNANLDVQNELIVRHEIRKKLQQLTHGLLQ